MRTVPIGAWLVLLSLALVFLVASGLALAANSLFANLAEENGRSRVKLALLAAEENLERIDSRTLTDARLLAERPTLLRLVAHDDHSGIASFLAQFRATSESVAGAVVYPGGVVSTEEAGFEWRDLEVSKLDGVVHVRFSASSDRFYAIAAVPLAGLLDGRAVIVRPLDPALPSPEEPTNGVEVRLLKADDGTPRSTRLLDGSWREQRVVLDDRGAELIVEAALSRNVIDQAFHPLRSRFAAVTSMASLIAVLAAIGGTRLLSRPFRVLRRAARRIASGDLVSPVPRTPGAEGAALSAVMEEMRQRILATTTELRYREHEAKALLEGIVEGVFAVDGERRIRYLNPQAARQLGTKAEDAIGQFCGDVLRPQERDGIRPCENACPIIHARSRGSSRSVEHLQLASGRRTVVITSSPPAGTKQVQVMRDETEVEAARRSRDAVLANVSHELKTPLSGQLASIELLIDELTTSGTPAALELASSLQRSTIRLARLIDNLLESVRIETGRASLRRQPVDLIAVVEAASATVLPLLSQRDQQLAVDLAPSLPAVDGDPVQLTQVFVNLFANANRFTPDAGSIRVDGTSDGGSVSISVEDSGPGIREGERSSVFDRFHRSHDLSDGMGLGLWIAKSIVERHGGTIALAHSARGARFVVTLPIRRDP